ncbi:hypothetical protein PISMIDRAFT_546938 [Pisolithus microcarpus 441]|uniref:Unplaced genomic scaffold scaffold_69, whole genome shotgun sequence n=1 Tax=Pisolithus microcarpus 441 TaxID=765257 RepID=A0A0C9Y977_9AGAM|nr:hypothetical protein PISMIDRAFT_546938 [Pisolithus microcarpus 441]
MSSRIEPLSLGSIQHSCHGRCQREQVSTRSPTDDGRRNLFLEQYVYQQKCTRQQPLGVCDFGFEQILVTKVK